MNGVREVIPELPGVTSPPRSPGLVADSLTARCRDFLMTLDSSNLTVSALTDD